MSCFPGKMNEYQDISLDRYDGVNLQSTVYFLSHKHEDHMVGLSSSSFKYRLETNCHIKFYCSEVTSDLLKSDPRHRWLEKYMVDLKVDVPYQLTVPDNVTGKEKYTVTVTPLHAGHCPGSVMFLFEGKEGTALYTGDIRLNRSDLQGFKSLHSSERPKHIDTLYVDTTFCVPNALFIPTRDESAEAVLQLTKQWLALGRNHFIRLKCSAGIGYEHLFIRIAQELDTKVHVSEQKHKEYTSIAAFPSFSTPDASESRIHCCSWNKDRPAESRLPCGYISSEKNLPMEIRTIMLSTMWFTQRAKLDDVYSARNPPYFYRVCYSFHSSYSELRDMVIYLKPSAVRPNVIPYQEKDFSAVQERLNRFQKIASQSIPESSDSQPRKLGLQRKRKRKVKPSISSESEGMDWGDLSPVKKPKLSQGSTEFKVNYKDLSSSQGSFKSTGSEKEEACYSSEAEDDESDLDILDGLEDDEDVKLVKEAFEPVQSGSYGDYVSYVSDMSDEENEDGSDAKSKNDKVESKGAEVQESSEEDKLSLSLSMSVSSSQKSEDVVKNNEDNTMEEITKVQCNGEAVSEESALGDIKDVTCAEEKSVNTDSGVISVEKEEATGPAELPKDVSSDTSVEMGDAKSEVPSCKGDESRLVNDNTNQMTEQPVCSKSSEHEEEKSSAVSLDQNESCQPLKELNENGDNELGCDEKKGRPLKRAAEEDNGSSDVEEVGHVLAENADDDDDDENDQLIDLTEDDDVSDKAESASLFSSDEDDSVLSDDADDELNGDKYVINSDGELFFEGEDSDGTVDDNTGETDDEIVISSDEEVSQKGPVIKQVARKSTAKRSTSVGSHTSDVNGCSNGDSKSESANVIILEDSLDGDNLGQSCAETSVIGKDNVNSVQAGETVEKESGSDEPDDKLTEKILETSAALCEKLNTAKEITKKSETQESESENIQCDNNSVSALVQSEEL